MNTVYLLCFSLSAIRDQGYYWGALQSLLWSCFLGVKCSLSLKTKKTDNKQNIREKDHLVYIHRSQCELPLKTLWKTALLMLFDVQSGYHLGTTEAYKVWYYSVIEHMQRDMGKWHAFITGHRTPRTEQLDPLTLHCTPKTVLSTENVYMCVFVTCEMEQGASLGKTWEQNTRNVWHVWWKCTWFQFISSEDINVFVYKPGEGLYDEQAPSEPEVCFSFHFWNAHCFTDLFTFSVQFISVLAHLQLSIGFNLLRALDVCVDLWWQEQF